MRGGSDEVNDRSGTRGEERTESEGGPPPRKTYQKGSSTDSQGGRGESDDDEADDFEDEPESQAALDAGQIVDEFERERAQQSAGTETPSSTSGGSQNHEYNPSDVPETRDGTPFEGWSSERMTNTVAHAIQDNNMKKWNFEAWNRALDNMTEGELEEAAVKAVTTEVERDGLGDDPTDYSDDGLETTDADPGLADSPVYRKKLGGPLTRVGRGNPERQREVFNRLAEEYDGPDTDIAEIGTMWFPSADVRREIYEEHDLESEADEKRPLKVQFADNHEDRADTFIGRYAGSTTSTTTQVSRALLMEYGPNKDADISRFNKGIPSEGIEPTEEFRETIDSLAAETAEYIEEEYDGEVTLMRGVSDEITANASVESWTTNYSTANGFDGHAIMEATFKPGEVIATNEIEKHRDWGYYKFSDEKEWTVLGGTLVDRIPEDMRADEHYEK